MQRWSAQVLFCLMLVLVVFIFACRDEGSDYVIGMVVSLSGPDKESGESIYRSAQMRVDEVNNEGGFNGRNVRIKVLDDASDLKRSETQLLSLQNDPAVLAVIGYPQRKILDGVVQLVVFTRQSSESNVGDTEAMESPWVYGLSYSDQYRQQLLAAHIRRFEPSRKVLIVNADGHVANERVGQFETLAKRAELVTRRVDVRDDAELVLSHDDAESIVLYAPKDQVMKFIKKIHTFDPKISIYGDQRVTNVIEKEAQDPLVANVFGCSPYTYAMARYENIIFRENFTDRYEVAPTIGGAFAYDAVSLIVDAIEKDPKTTRKSIQESLAKRTTTITAYPGATARLYFDKHQFVRRPLIVQHVFDKSLRPAFKQLRRVPRNAPRDKAHVIVDVDGEAYYEQSVVYIGLDFESLDSIDAQKKEVDISGLVWMKWQGDFSPETVTLVNAAAKVEKVKLKQGPYAEEVRDMPGLRRADKTSNTSDVMFAVYKYNLPVRHEFALSDFPFDKQIIPIRLTDPSTDNNDVAFVADSDYVGDAKLLDPNWTQIGRKDYAAYFGRQSSFGAYKHSERAAFPRTNISMYEVRVVLEREVFGYVFSLFVPIFACLLLCFLAFFVKMEDPASRLAMITGSFFVAVLSHSGLRSSVGVSYLIAADVYYFICYGSIIASILAVNFVEHKRHHDDSLARKNQFMLRRTIMFVTFVICALYTVKFLFLL